MSEELGKAVLKELGKTNDNIEKINDISYKDLYNAGQKAVAASIGFRSPGTPMMWVFGPSPNGETLLNHLFNLGFLIFLIKFQLWLGQVLIYYKDYHIIIQYL